MFSNSKDKLQQTRDLLTGLVAEFDELLGEMREGVLGAAGDDVQPDYVRRIVRQRELLVAAAGLLAELRLEIPGNDRRAL